MWLVVMNSTVPSCVATPSSAFRKPLKDSLTCAWAASRSRKNASTSSISSNERCGTEASSVWIFSSVTTGLARLSVQTFRRNSLASAVTSDVLPVPGGPYSR